MGPNVLVTRFCKSASQCVNDVSTSIRYLTLSEYLDYIDLAPPY